jgi:hypothetical protein
MRGVYYNLSGACHLGREISSEPFRGLSRNQRAARGRIAQAARISVCPREDLPKIKSSRNLPTAPPACRLTPRTLSDSFPAQERTNGIGRYVVLLPQFLAAPTAAVESFHFFRILRCPLPTFTLWPDQNAIFSKECANGVPGNTTSLCNPIYAPLLI